MSEPTVGDLARRQEDEARAMQRLTVAMDRLSSRIESLPDTIDRTYVRKDVANERATRVDSEIASLVKNQKEYALQTQEQFEKMAAWVRWLLGGLLVPIVLVIFTILSSRNGGLG